MSAYRCEITNGNRTARPQSRPFSGLGIVVLLMPLCLQACRKPDLRELKDPLIFDVRWTKEAAKGLTQGASVQSYAVKIGHVTNVREEKDAESGQQVVVGTLYIHTQYKSKVRQGYEFRVVAVDDSGQPTGDNAKAGPSSQVKVFVVKRANLNEITSGMTLDGHSE